MAVWHEPWAITEVAPDSYFRNPACLSSECFDELSKKIISSRVEYWSNLLAQGKSVAVIGWTAYPVLSYLLNVFKSNAALLHIVREPIRCSASHFAHGMYHPWQKFAKRSSKPLTANCDHLFDGDFYKSKWDGFTPFMKSVARWIQINSLAEELKEDHPSIPFMRARFEDLGPELIDSIFEFMDFVPHNEKELPAYNSQSKNRKARRPIFDDCAELLKLPSFSKLNETFEYSCDPHSMNEKLAGYRCASIRSRLISSASSFPPLGFLYYQAKQMLQKDNPKNLDFLDVTHGMAGGTRKSFAESPAE